MSDANERISQIVNEHDVVLFMKGTPPTIPQLYVKGEFVGGSDIMMEMYEAGELQQLLTEKVGSPS